MVSEKQKKEILSNEDMSTNSKAQKMIDLALENGGNDNITVIIMEK